MGYTLAEKILMKNVGHEVHADDLITVHPDCVMVIDSYTPYVYDKFKQMQFEKVWDPDKVVLIHDHFVPCFTPGNVNL